MLWEADRPWHACVIFEAKITRLVSLFILWEQSVLVVVITFILLGKICQDCDYFVDGYGRD